MSYGLMAFSVDSDHHNRTIDSGDDGKLREICGRFKRAITSTNNQLDWSNERGEPGVFEAIRHLVMRDPKTLPGAMYAYGYKHIVEYHGRFLDNSTLYPCSLSVMRGA